MKLIIASCAILLVGGIVAFFLLRRSTEGTSETIEAGGMKVTIGPAQKMSGPEFLAMLAKEGGDRDPNAEFLYIRIPDPVVPVERGRKYGEPIDAVLSAKSLGTVTGGGSMMNADNSIEYVGLDVTVYDLEESLRTIAAKLREIGAPKGTVIVYGDDESKHLDIWEDRNCSITPWD